MIDVFALGSALAALLSVCQTGNGFAENCNMDLSLLRFKESNDACHVGGFGFEKVNEC